MWVEGSGASLGSQLRAVVLYLRRFCSPTPWPREHLATFLLVIPGKEEVTLVPSGWRLRILLIILQCTGEPPTTVHYLVPNAQVPRLRNPALKGGTCSSWSFLHTTSWSLSWQLWPWVGSHMLRMVKQQDRKLGCWCSWSCPISCFIRWLTSRLCYLKQNKVVVHVNLCCFEFSVTYSWI